MRDELSPIYAAIQQGQLPVNFLDLFGPLWDGENNRFHAQESVVNRV